MTADVHVSPLTTVVEHSIKKCRLGVRSMYGVLQLPAASVLRDSTAMVRLSTVAVAT